ncbi:DUF4082 domain-containing protein [Actinoallomurus spadix]|nr:DUF4082 domain-containing protein [Actinoallomurus spadix]MCO5987761.1 DUF4082 domain-containing protein [Actinoallomurus spadix]
MSVAQGETAQFKVLTPATAYHMDIYRMGYYGGLGARLIDTVQPSAALPQTQPNCLTDGTTGLIDCGNWAVSASWAVPASAVSGVYIAKLVRDDVTGEASQIIFVVRDDTRRSDFLVQTSDATWEAYNSYGGNSLYTGAPAGRAFKVSYNRPFTTRSADDSVYSWFFDSEYPMVRWLEANAFDVSYTTNVDTAMRGAEILEHKVFMSSGHDEYWSNEMRNNVQAARDNGVNLTFFSGNEVFWKTRWENSIADGASFRTLVCYKETLANNTRLDPTPTWTGTWRDPRYSPPADGGRPENALTGTLFMVNGVANDSIQVPADFSDMRLWRNTSIAGLSPGQTATFPTGTLGYEWDEAPDNAVTPPGLVKYSRTTGSTSNRFLLNYGSQYGAGTATHSLVLYRAPSGALVFGAGTTQWAWGLDAVHDRAGSPTDITMQQATVNLFADMGTQPASLQSGLVPATPSTDTSPPTSTITNPSSGAGVVPGRSVTVQGTATDTGGGVVGGVEVSFDGVQWFHAAGRSAWQYPWTPTGNGPVTIRVRAVDDIGNVQANPTTVNVTVGGTCCTLWSSTTVPDVEASGDFGSVEVGVKFRATATGEITGVRFYKGTANTGTHVGHLWSSTGTLLAEATFTNETASGWQQVNFATPVAVSANTTYVASYHTAGHYAVSRSYFVNPFNNYPLIALAGAASGGNGVYVYNAAATFPAGSFQSTNYWVDVVFMPSSSLWDNSAVPGVQSNADTNAATLGVKFTASANGSISGIRFFKGSLNTGTHVGSLWAANGTLLATATFTSETASGWQQVNFSTPVAVTANSTYVASYFTSSGYYSVTRGYFANAYVNGPLTALAGGASGGNGVYAYGAASTFPTGSFQSTNYWVDVVFTPSSSLWDNSAVPAVQSNPDTKAVTLGVKFTASVSGSISGIRFFKGSLNTGTHVGSLWTANGTLLATATFTNETASGWQQVNFSSPVAVTANTTYVASYFTSSGYYSVTQQYFANAYVSGPLTALASGASGGNGVYAYGAANTFPTGSYQSTNYWVDVVLAGSS